MRIQETDRVLKEAKYARHAMHEDEDSGFIARLLLAGIVAVLAVIGVAAYFTREKWRF